MNTATESLVGKLLTPVFQALPPDVARRIVNLEADEAAQLRVADLARKANEGELTPEEHAEYEACIDAGDILATLQVLARRTLERTAP
ncbi:MAG: hypothetical protein SFV23_11315 [Planctomycetaceae bacterium]|nr:hypothetical protein [Planctomycetaceae bacterium]